MLPFFMSTSLLQIKYKGFHFQLMGVTNPIILAVLPKGLWLFPHIDIVKTNHAFIRHVMSIHMAFTFL